MVDKYDMSSALSSYGEACLLRFNGSKGGDDHLIMMLWISHAFGSHYAFWRLSGDMIRTYTQSELRKEGDDMEDTSLPISVTSKLLSAT